MAVGPRAVTVFVHGVSSPRRQNVRGALANVHELVVSPSLLSPSSVKQLARWFTIPCIEKVRSLNLNIITHVQVKFADLKFTVIARSKQTHKHIHALRNEVTLVWGSLRLAPINCLPTNDCKSRHELQRP